MYKISGVHHVALGVKDLELLKSFYRDVLGFDKVFIEFPETEHREIHEVMRGVYPVFGASLLYQAAGGIILELVRMKEPAPRPIRKDFRYGDIGVNKIAMVVHDVIELYRDLRNQVNFYFPPRSVEIEGWGNYNFVYGRDPEGNLLEFVSGSKLPVKARFGGFRWAGISVTDLERSKSFYQKYAGFDTVVINVHERFSGLVDEISGGRQTRVRSCLLATGAGEGMIELFEVLEPRGRSLPAFTVWGDYGYWQACVNCHHVPELAAYLENQGLPFFSRLQLMHDEHEGAFLYVQDPDGIPLEFLGFLKP